MTAEQQLLFGPLCDGFHAHVEWHPVEGWSLWVNSWLEGGTATAGLSEGYSRMTLEELLCVLDAEAVARVGYSQRRR
jgi:hypothetical protein